MRLICLDSHSSKTAWTSSFAYPSRSTSSNSARTSSRSFFWRMRRISAAPGVLATKTLVAVPHLEPEDEDRDQFSAWT